MKINVKYLVVISIMLTLLFFIETVSFHGDELKRVDHPYAKLTYSSGYYRILDLDDAHALMLEILNAEKLEHGIKIQDCDEDAASHLVLYFPCELTCDSKEGKVCNSYCIVDRDDQYLVYEEDGEERYLLNKEESEHFKDLLSRDVSKDEGLF